MRKIVASYTDQGESSVLIKSEPSSPSILSPAPMLIRDYSENGIESIDESTSQSQAITGMSTAQSSSSKQVLYYTSTALKQGISGRIDGSDSAARSALDSAPKTEEDELLDKLVHCEGVLGLGQQDDEKGAAVPRVSFFVSRYISSY
jgi:hypothetical protein